LFELSRAVTVKVVVAVPLLTTQVEPAESATDATATPQVVVKVVV